MEEYKGRAVIRMQGEKDSFYDAETILYEVPFNSGKLLVSLANGAKIFGSIMERDDYILPFGRFYICIKLREEDKKDAKNLIIKSFPPAII